uniref:Succinate dehydrogenase assembly factor 2, mitochondrial n=1 Tax=Culex pipiens TaxID=7175 RepID=A0A8D8FUD5_CULPI
MALFCLSRCCAIRGMTAVGWSLRTIGTSRASLAGEGERPPPMIDLEDKSLPIPIYKEKHNEPLKLQKSRLLYQSRKRGMLENGLLLSTFAAKYLESLDARQTKLYDTLINMPTNDWDIFYWATGVKPTPQEYDNEIMNMLKEHVKNANKEKRLCQPALY